jgi:ribosomal protein S18 acetylase RimI-like enzyme
MKAIRAHMEAEPDFFLGAFEDDVLIGTVIVTSDRRKGWINRLAVDLNHRRSGVARALIAESEKILKDRGIKIFCCLVEGCNKSSRELFRNCGYTEHGNVTYFSKRNDDRV